MKRKFLFNIYYLRTNEFVRKKRTDAVNMNNHLIYLNLHIDFYLFKIIVYIKSYYDKRSSKLGLFCVSSFYYDKLLCN